MPPRTKVRHHHHHHHYRPHSSAPRITVPPTTQFTVIFPLKSGAFDTTSYVSSVTDDRASLEEINNTLRDVNEARTPGKRQQGIIIFFYILSILAVIVGGAIALAILISKTTIVIPVVVIGGTVLIIIFICLFRALLESNRKKQQELVRGVVNSHNQNFGRKGLRWNIPYYFPMWIELVKEYKYQVPPQQMAMGNHQQGMNFGGNNMMRMGQDMYAQQNMGYEGYQIYPQQNNSNRGQRVMMMN